MQGLPVLQISKNRHALAYRNGIDEQMIFIDKPLFYQRGDERAAAVRDNVPSGQLLKFVDLRRQLAGSEAGVGPGAGRQRTGKDDFRGVVEFVDGPGVFVNRLRCPVRDKSFRKFPSKDDGVYGSSDLANLFFDIIGPGKCHPVHFALGPGDEAIDGDLHL